MKQTAYFPFQFVTYLAMAIMLVPNKISTEGSFKQPNTKVEIRVAAACDNRGENLKEELLFRF